jgi:Copper chaperone
MTQTYHIQGMTCKGCKDSVTRAFNALEGVEAVEVILKRIALIGMSTAVQHMF